MTKAADLWEKEPRSVVLHKIEDFIPFSKIRKEKKELKELKSGQHSNLVNRCVNLFFVTDSFPVNPERLQAA